MIYFIQAEGIGHIKIGFTDKDDAALRLAELQTGSPVPLRLLGVSPGDVLAEKNLTPFAALDFETADDQRDSACAVGVARVEGGRVVYADAALIRPPRSRVKFTEIHGLRWEDLRDQPPFVEVWKRFAPLLDGCTRIAAHNAPFDRSVLEACCRAANIPPPTLPWVCTLKLARARWPKPASNRLPAVCERLGVVLEKHHHAGADAEACARVLIALESLEAGHADRGDGGGHPGRIRNSCRLCPVARAIQRATGLDLVWVSSSFVEFRHQDQPLKVLDLPSEAAKWIRDYDLGRGMQPFSFDLPIPTPPASDPSPPPPAPAGPPPPNG